MCYLLPHVHIDDLLAALSGGKVFSKLDLAHTFQHVLLNEESKYTTINTTKELFQYACLRIFWDIISSCDISTHHDILVPGINEEDHLNNLDKIMLWDYC